jgi:hypothetical protein
MNRSVTTGTGASFFFFQLVTFDAGGVLVPLDEGNRLEDPKQYSLYLSFSPLCVILMNVPVTLYSLMRVRILVVASVGDCKCFKIPKHGHPVEVTSSNRGGLDPTDPGSPPRPAVALWPQP